MLEIITMYADGACSGNPGLGGWGCIIDFNNVRKEFSGGEKMTTNNRMELTGVIKALQYIKTQDVKDIPCVFYTDSQYVQKGISEWIKKWKLNGWKTASKEPVKNKDLWEELSEVSSLFKIEWKWLKGHAGHPENERCDELARNAIQKLK